MSKNKSEKANYKTMFANKKFVFFLVYYCLVMGTTTSSDSFFSVYLESRDVTKEMYGLVYSYIVFFEVVVLLFLNKYGRKFSHNNLLLIFFTFTDGHQEL